MFLAVEYDIMVTLYVGMENQMDAYVDGIVVERKCYYGR